jgi:hypothetical protein
VDTDGSIVRFFSCIHLAIVHRVVLVGSVP